MKSVFGIAVVSAIMLICAAVPTFALDSEYVIVANKSVQGASIGTAQLKGIYLREIRNWGNGGGEILVVDLTNASGFYQNLFGKSYLQMQTYWMKMRSNYSMDLPVFKKDSESVKQFIAANKDAIGFIKSSDVDDSVKVIKLIN